ncbi:MAG TPA: PQQ-binding-like beta-propeller repeat protein, partial [Hyphomonadaceae bacterium]|nr:PQQ-binding-like beta-propeller repeat protein [Hyphomonadaceae bacterium]
MNTRTAATVVLTVLFCSRPIASFSQDVDVAALYQRNCAQCHDNGTNRAPLRETFLSMTPERVLAAMETGAMVTMANNRTAAERRAIAEFLTGKKFGTALSTTPAAAAMCRAQNRAFDPATGPRWAAWGNSNNARFQDAAAARLTAADVPRLKLKWAFAFPGDLQSYSQATLAGGRIFVGSWGGKVYSLDASSGCVHWFFDAGSGVRSAISLAESGSRHIAVFGDMAANVVALDAVTGQLIWRAKIDDFPVARVSASPTVYNGRVYLGVASGEEGAAAVPTYECCRFRGSIVALDLATGKQLWKTFLIPDAPRPTKKNAAGAQLWGPSGVPVWGTAVVDARRNAL